MYLLVNINGSKYFRYNYRFNTNRKTLALGVYPVTSLKEAREKRDTAIKQITGSSYQDHQPTECVCCSRTFSKAEIESSKAYTAFDSLGIEWGNPERPGIDVVNTRHTYYQTQCACGHNTRAVAFRHPPDNELTGIELSEWRLVDATLASFIVCLSLRLRLSRVRIREFLSDWLVRNTFAGDPFISSLQF